MEGGEWDRHFYHLRRIQDFFCQSLSESKAFVNTIWSTIKKNFQHQLEEIIDWAAYLEHLQTVFCKFNADKVISEPILIRLFYKSLQPSIYAQAKQDSRWNDT